MHFNNQKISDPTLELATILANGLLRHLAIGRAEYNSGRNTSNHSTGTGHYPLAIPAFQSNESHPGLNSPSDTSRLAKRGFDVSEHCRAGPSPAENDCGGIAAGMEKGVWRTDQTETPCLPLETIGSKASGGQVAEIDARGGGQGR